MKLLHQGDKKLSFAARGSLSFPLHLHNAVELVYLHRGSSRAFCAGKSYALEAGDLFLAFPSQIHGFEEDQAVEASVLIVPLHPYLDSFRPLLEQQAPPRSVLKKGEWEKRGVARFLKDALAEWEEMGEEEKKGYLLLIFARLLPLFACEKRAPVDSAAAETALRYLAEHFTEPLSRKDLAEALNYNESYLSHLFSQSLGTTLTDYLTSLRVSEACRLLNQSDASVSHIAFSLGFGSIRSFNRAFRRATSLSPSEYRRRIRSAPHEIKSL